MHFYLSLGMGRVEVIQLRESIASDAGNAGQSNKMVLDAGANAGVDASGMEDDLALLELELELAKDTVGLHSNASSSAAVLSVDNGSAAVQPSKSDKLSKRAKRMAKEEEKEKQQRNVLLMERVRVLCCLRACVEWLDV